MSRAFDLLVEMNPVPRSDVLERSSEQWGDDGAVEPLRPGAGYRRRGWLPVLAGAMAVIVVGAAIWTVGIGRDGDFAAGDTPLAGRTERLFASFNAGDYAAFRSAFSDEPRSLSAVSGWRFITAAVDSPTNAAPADFGFAVVADCREIRPGAVRCDLTQRGGVFDRIGVTIPGTAMVLYNDEDAIYALNLDSRLQVDAETALDEFAAWLRDAHPDVFEATFDAFSNEQIPPNGIDTVDNRAAWTAVVGDFMTDRSGE